MTEARDEHEHVILVAFSVSHATREEAHRALVDQLTRVPGVVLSPWWVAEDDRIDGSDNDSAVFVPPGSQAHATWRMVNEGLTPEHNRVEPARSWKWHERQSVAEQRRRLDT